MGAMTSNPQTPFPGRKLELKQQLTAVKNNQSKSTIIEQANLSEKCPCGSDKSFGACCGSDDPCDCNSKWPAGECCYYDELNAPTSKDIKNLGNEKPKTAH